jgi:hypothetical protein
MRVVALLVVATGLTRLAPADEPKRGPAGEDAFARMVKVLKFGEVNAYTQPIKGDAVVALGLLGDERAVPVLLDHLANETDDHIRFQIVNALGWLRSPKAVPGLEKALKDPDEHVRDGAVAALKTITGKDYPTAPPPARPAGAEPRPAPAGLDLEVGKTYRLTLARAGGGELVGKVLSGPADGWLRVEVRRGDRRIASWVNLRAVEVVTPEPAGDK